MPLQLIFPITITILPYRYSRYEFNHFWRLFHHWQSSPNIWLLKLLWYYSPRFRRRVRSRDFRPCPGAGSNADSIVEFPVSIRMSSKLRNKIVERDLSVVVSKAPAVDELKVLNTPDCLISAHGAGIHRFFSFSSLPEQDLDDRAWSRLESSKPESPCQW